MVLPNTQCAMGSLTSSKRGVLALMAALALLLGACSNRGIEIHTREVVTVYSEPDFPSRSGNQVVGSIPAGVTLRVEKQVIEKDHAAYKIEYKNESGTAIRGYVILSESIEVRYVGSVTSGS